LTLRKKFEPFNPNAKQKILDIDKRLFAVLRCDELSNEGILSVVNVSNKSFSVDFAGVKELFENEENVELISNKKVSFSEKYSIDPFEILWIKGKLKS
jgi:sucrose phosphorylase